MAYVKAEKRYCKTCGSPIIPKSYITSKEYAARVYCSLACNNKAGDIRRKTAEEKAKHDRYCVQCGGLISLNLPKWSKYTPSALPKRFCSNKCQGESVALKREPTFCKACNKVLVRREGERLSSFYERRYCDTVCRGAKKKVVDLPKLDLMKVKNEGKFWGSKKDVEKLIQHLEEKGYCLNYKGNDRKVKWRDGVKGWGVKWFFDYEMVKVYSYTQSREVFKTYGGTYAY